MNKTDRWCDMHMQCYVRPYDAILLAITRPLYRQLERQIARWLIERFPTNAAGRPLRRLLGEAALSYTKGAHEPD
jgi:hypothetical protein